LNTATKFGTMDFKEKVNKDRLAPGLAAMHIYPLTKIKQQFVGYCGPIEDM